MGFLGNWFRWLLLSSLFFAAIGLAEEGNSGDYFEPLRDLSNLPDFDPPKSPLPYEMPAHEAISEQQILVNIPKELLKGKSPAEQETFQRELRLLVLENFTFKPGTMLLPPESRFTRTDVPQVDIVFPEDVNPQNELDASVAEFAKKNPRPPGSLWSWLTGNREPRPSKRLIQEQWDDFAAHGTISYPSANHPELSHLFRVNLLFKKIPYYEGNAVIMASIKRAWDNGIYELVVTIPESFWPEDASANTKLSVKQSLAQFGKNIGTLLDQFIGLRKSVPAYSPWEAQQMVEQLRRYNIAEATLKTAAFHAFQQSRKTSTEPWSAFSQALMEIGEEWRKKGEKQARQEVANKIGLIEREHGLTPQTRKNLELLGMEVAERDFTAKHLIAHPELSKVARSEGADLRFYDGEVMAAVERRLEELEKIHEKNWINVRDAMASAAYSEALSMHPNDIPLAQANAVERLREKKQEHFANLIQLDSGLDTCHPRATGMRALLAEKTRALIIISNSEQKFEAEIQKEREATEAEVRSEYLIGRFSQKFIDEKVAERQTERYHARRTERYHELVAKLWDADCKNTSTQLAAELAEAEQADSLRKEVQEKHIPARAFEMKKIAMEPSEWTIVGPDGKKSGSPAFSEYVDTMQGWWRFRLFVKSWAQAYRFFRNLGWQQEFARGRYGLVSVFDNEPFPYEQTVNPETGKVEWDLTKTRATLYSNWRSVAQISKRIATAPAWGPIPNWMWRIGCWGTGAACFVTGIPVVTGVRAALTPMTLAAGALVGSPPSAAVLGGAYAALSIGGFDPFVYDRHSSETKDQKAAQPGAIKQLRQRQHLLGWTATGVGVLAGTYVDVLQFATATWPELGKTFAQYSGTGLATGLALATLASLEMRNVAKVPSAVLGGIAATGEGVTLALGKILAKVGVVGWNTLGVAGAGAAVRYVRDFSYRNILLKLLVDKISLFLGGGGAEIPNRSNFFMTQINGPGEASQHFQAFPKEHAVTFPLLCLYAAFEKIDLEHWDARRAIEAKGPRENYLQKTGMRQLALTGSNDLSGTLVGRLIQKFEEEDQKFRSNFAAERAQNVKKLLDAAAEARRKKVKFHASELNQLLREATQLAKVFVEKLAHPETTPTQRLDFFLERGVPVGNYELLAQKMLIEQLGIDAMLSREDTDAAAYSEVTMPSLSEIWNQVKAGEDLNVDSVTVVHAVPPSVLKAKPLIPFFGAKDLCSKELRMQATLTWNLPTETESQPEVPELE